MLLFDDENKCNKVFRGQSINLAISKINEQFPNIIAFTDSSIDKCQQFDIVSREYGYIQILNAGSMHWICVSNITSATSSNQVLYIFDSLLSQKIQQDVIPKITPYSFSLKSELTIHVISVQQQKIGVDFGLIAIVFAISLALGDDQSNTTYNFAALRPDLIKGMTLQIFTIFKS